jgi:hypothetical protein
MTSCTQRRLLLLTSALLLAAVAGEVAWLMHQGPRLARAQAHSDAMLREPDPSARRRGLTMVRVEDQWRLDAVSAIRTRQLPWLEAFVVDEGIDPVTASRLRQALAIAVNQQINRICVGEHGSYTPKDTAQQLAASRVQRERLLRHLLGDERGALLAMLVNLELAAELDPEAIDPAAGPQAPSSTAGD